MTTNIEPIVTPQGYKLEQHPEPGWWLFRRPDGQMHLLSSTEEIQNLHRAVAMLGCDDETCPCRVHGVEQGLERERPTLRVEVSA